ncbi:hypothetical protein POTOM_033936 [Populus tomentosa]|uniref:Uncharacterized protein n=1 Tax=Populus tomentosa TaxID=118781 RepID=A0A8X7Z1R1_POPTO|nr:hypothetical protein POTOM_033936 [Populus tomentosa]
MGLTIQKYGEVLLEFGLIYCMRSLGLLLPSCIAQGSNSVYGEVRRCLNAGLQISIMDGYSNKKRANHGGYRKSFLSLVKLYALDLVISIS